MTTDVLGVLGFAISLFTFLWDRWSQLADARSANLIVRLNNPNGDRYLVLVANTGRSVARDVRIELDGKLAEERVNYQRPDIPFPEAIAPNAIRIYEYLGRAPSHAKATWRNRWGFGSGSFETMLVA